jgi:DNA-binding CsgD family transcriptional regulator
MTSSSRSVPDRDVVAIADNLAAREEVRRSAERNPAVPQRLLEVVRWVDANMREAGLRLTLEPASGATAGGDWAARFALTPAEARLASHLLKGGTPATFAAERSLSPHTVRNHLRSIYAKTNTNRQVSLLQLLLRSSGKNP